MANNSAGQQTLPFTTIKSSKYEIKQRSWLHLSVLDKTTFETSNKLLFQQPLLDIRHAKGESHTRHLWRSERSVFTGAHTIRVLSFTAGYCAFSPLRPSSALSPGSRGQDISRNGYLTLDTRVNC